MTSYRMLYDIICAKDTRWPDCHEFVIFHIIAYLLVHCNGIIYHTKVYEETFDVNSKIALAMQHIYKFLFGKSSLQLNGKFWWISRRFHTLIWRRGDMVQNMESPGSSGRIDMHWTGLLIIHGKKVKFCGIFGDKIAEKSVDFVGIFRVNLAGKQSVNKRRILWLFSDKFRKKLIGFALIRPAFLMFF